MNDYFDEYNNLFNKICNKIDKFDFNLNDLLIFPIESFENEYHNRLAAYNICKKINDNYMHLNIKAHLSKINQSNVVIYKERKIFSIRELINKIKSYYE